MADGYPYERYGIADSLEEDELLSSPPRNRSQRVSMPVEALATMPTLTWQTSTIRRPSTTTTPHHHTQPRPARISRFPPEPHHTPQRMDLTQDPAFFQALGQSIAQGIAQYMSNYHDTPRAADPVWDAPPLPRPSCSARRPAPPPPGRRQMIPESPRHPPSRSLWSTGRSAGRPRAQDRPSERPPEPSPSIRSNALPRQTLTNAQPQRSRYNIPQWNEVGYEEEEGESFREPEGNGHQEAGSVDIVYEDQDQANTWAEEDDVMDIEGTTEVEDPLRISEMDDIGNPDSLQVFDHTPNHTQQSLFTHHDPDATSLTPGRPLTGPIGNGNSNTGYTIPPEAVQQSLNDSNTERRGTNGPLWMDGDNELFIELREARQLSIPQICRYFPDRSPRSVSAHWYKVLSNRPDKTRGPMSDYVRRALERGPILANKLRMKPYVPKDPEKAKPHLANLADPDDWLDHSPQTVPDFESDASVRSSQELSTTPDPQMLAVNEPSNNTSQIFEGTEEGGIVPTDDPKRPWGCGRCGAKWTSKRGARYHFAVPERCMPQPSGRLNRGRKPKHIIPQRVQPPKAVPFGVDISTGRPATFNPNILVREDMQRPHLCVLCGKSWISHSNAREHTKRPETCKPENWLTNYDPAAHRKRIPTQEAVGDGAQEAQPSKRQKRDDNAAQQLLEAAGGRTPQAPPKDDHVSATVQRPTDSFPQVTTQSMNDVQLVQDAAPEPVLAPRRGFPKRFTVLDRPSVVAGSSKQIPIDPKLIDTSKVMEAVEQHTSFAQQVLGISPPELQRDESFAARMTNGKTAAIGAAVVARDHGSFFNNDAQPPSPQTQSAAESTIQQAHPLIRPERSHEEDISPACVKQRATQAVGDNPTPRNGASAASIQAPTTRVSNTGERSSLPKSSPKAEADMRKKATPSRSTQKSVASKSASQPARPASKASSTKQLPKKPRPSATPRTKLTGEAASSSPLSRVAKSEPRPSASFIDLLADVSEDELAL